MATVNTNQFQQVPIQGDLDLQIMESKTISGVMDAAQATALVAGTGVKLQSSNTGKVPKFIKADQADVAVGYIKRTVQATTFSAGDKVEVCGHFGPVMWLLAGGTITPGAALMATADESGVMATSGNPTVGIALDYALTGQLLRVILLTPTEAETA